PARGARGAGGTEAARSGNPQDAVFRRLQHRRDRRAAGSESEVRAKAADEGPPPRGAELSPERIAMTKHSDDLLHIASCCTCRDRFTADNVVNFAADRPREPERMR